MQKYKKFVKLHSFFKYFNHSLDIDSVFDFLLYMFPLYLKRAIKQGVYKEYVTKQYNDSNERGTLDANRQIRYNEPFNAKVAYSTREYCPLKIPTEQNGTNGGTITKIGLRIPSNCTSFQEFAEKIEEYEQIFLSQI